MVGTAQNPPDGRFSSVRQLGSIAQSFAILVSGALLALAATVGSVSAQDQGEPAHEPQTLDDLFELFEVQDEPADFVVVIDISGSMFSGDNPPWPRVVDAFDELITAIPSGDRLSLVLFSETAATVYSEAIRSDDARAEARAKLDEVVPGDFTDIGAALASALKRLERADSSQIQTLIVFTDGHHDPNLNITSYAATTGQPWDALSERSGDLASRRSTEVLGFGVGEGGTDIALVGRVFPSPEIIELPPEQLTGFFQEAVRRSQLRRLAIAVDAELGSGSVGFSRSQDAKLAESMTVQVDITSNWSRLPVTVRATDVSISSSDGRQATAELLGTDTWRLLPGQSASLELRIDTEVANPRFQIPVNTESADFDIDLDFEIRAQPESLLRSALGTSATHTENTSTRYRVRAERDYGHSIWWLVVRILAVLLALLILRAIYKRFLQLPKLVGVIDRGEGFEDTDRYVALRGKRMTIGKQQIPGAMSAELRLTTRRGKPRRVFALVAKPQVHKVINGYQREAVHGEFALKFFDTFELDGAPIQYLPNRP